MRHLHVLQQVPFEEPGVIPGWGWDRGYRVDRTRYYLGEDPPSTESVDLAVVLGGPMSVHDESRYPWLRDQKRLLETLVGTDTPVLGIGLGCRLLAQVLGGAVESAPIREIGWFPVDRTSGASSGTPTGIWPDRMTVLHWHAETFEVPEGGCLLARGEADLPEAFGWDDRVVGLQFHLEVTARGVERLLYNPSGDLLNGGGDRVQNPEDIRAGTDHLEELHPRLFDLLDGLSRGGGE